MEIRTRLLAALGSLLAAAAIAASGALAATPDALDRYLANAGLVEAGDAVDRALASAGTPEAVASPPQPDALARFLANTGRAEAAGPAVGARGGVDWADAGVGAGIALGAVVLAALLRAGRQWRVASHSS